MQDIMGILGDDQESFHRAMVKRMLATGEYGKAADSLTALIRLAPKNISYMKMAAMVYQKIDHREQAAFCYLRLAELYAAKKDFAAVAKTLDRWQALQPANATAIRRDLYHFCRQHGCTLAEGLGILEASERIVCFLHEHPAFRFLHDHAFAELMHALSPVTLSDGECVARCGEAADCLFLVMTGALLPVVEGSDGTRHAMTSFGSASIVGEVPFLTGEGKRTADLYAQGTTTLYTLSYQQLARLTEKYPVIRQCLEQQYRVHISERMLGEAPFFRHYTTAQRRQIASQMSLVDVAADTTLFEYGARDELDFYVVVSGWFSVSAPVRGSLRHLYTASVGDVLGELGVLQNVRHLTVRAVSEGQLLRWPEAMYRQCFMKDENLRNTLSLRLQRLNQKITAL